MKSITTTSKPIIPIIKLIFFLLAFLTYLLFETVLPGRVNAIELYYIYKPAAWLVLGVSAYIFIINIKELRIPVRKTVLLASAAAGFIQVALLFTAGIFTQFGRSPYLFTPEALLMNTFYFASSVFGIELIRALLLSHINRRLFAEWIFFTAVFFALLEIPLSAYRFADSISLLNFFSGRLIPMLAINLLAGILAYAGGFQSALVYRFILSSFEWFSPILPDLPWYLNTSIKTIVPVLFIVYIAVSQRDLFPQDDTAVNSRSVWEWVAVGIISVIIFWFFSGIFAFKPILVAGRSMTPALNLGDVVIYQKVAPEKISTGDIIVFATPAGTVIHRVIKVEESNGRYYFTTKGDANKSPDHELVLQENILGKVIFRIPYLGWISIALKNALFGF